MQSKMQPATFRSRHKILLRVLLWLLILTHPVLITFYVFEPDLIRSTGFALDDKFGEIASFSTRQRVLTWLYSVVNIMPVIICFLIILKLLDTFDPIRGLDDQTVERFARLSRLFYVYLLLTFLSDPALSVIASMENAPGERELQLSVSSNMVILACLALFGSLIVQTLRDARARQRELDEIV